LFSKREAPDEKEKKEGKKENYEACIWPCSNEKFLMIQSAGSV
jgi:hypothetical protein